MYTATGSGTTYCGLVLQRLSQRDFWLGGSLTRGPFPLPQFTPFTDPPSTGGDRSGRHAKALRCSLQAEGRAMFGCVDVWMYGCMEVGREWMLKWKTERLM